MGYVKGGCLWAIIKWIFVVSLAFTIWTMGVVGALSSPTERFPTLQPARI